MGRLMFVALWMVVLSQMNLKLVFSGHIPGEVTTNCKFNSTHAKIVYKGDPQAVVAVNSKQQECLAVENVAEASYTLYIMFNSTQDTNCVFDKKAGMAIYTIEVQARLTVAFMQDSDDELFNIECSFETYADDVSSGSAVEQGIKNPVIISQNNGEEAASNFTIEVIKIDGKSFQNPSIRLGRVVQLRAVMTGTANETGFLITNCKALTTDGNESSVLISDGCGTGFPFGSKEGFTLSGLTATSPSFRMFRIKRDQGLKFQCSFIICNERCPQNSCSSARRKRSVNMVSPFNELSGDPFKDRNRRSAISASGHNSSMNELIKYILGERSNQVEAIHRIHGGVILDVTQEDVLRGTTSLRPEKGPIKQNNTANIASSTSIQVTDENEPSTIGKDLKFDEDNSSKN